MPTFRANKHTPPQPSSSGAGPSLQVILVTDFSTPDQKKNDAWKTFREQLKGEGLELSAFRQHPLVGQRVLSHAEEPAERALEALFPRLQALMRAHETSGYVSMVPTSRAANALTRLMELIRTRSSLPPGILRLDPWVFPSGLPGLTDAGIFPLEPSHSSLTTSAPATGATPSDLPAITAQEGAARLFASTPAVPSSGPQAWWLPTATGERLKVLCHGDTEIFRGVRFTLEVRRGHRGKALTRRPPDATAREAEPGDRVVARWQATDAASAGANLELTFLMERDGQLYSLDGRLSQPQPLVPNAEAVELHHALPEPGAAQIVLDERGGTRRIVTVLSPRLDVAGSIRAAHQQLTRYQTQGWEPPADDPGAREGTADTTTGAAAGRSALLGQELQEQLQRQARAGNLQNPVIAVLQSPRFDVPPGPTIATPALKPFLPLLMGQTVVEAQTLLASGEVLPARPIFHPPNLKALRQKLALWLPPQPPVSEGHSPPVHPLLVRFLDAHCERRLNAIALEEQLAKLKALETEALEQHEHCLAANVARELAQCLLGAHALIPAEEALGRAVRGHLDCEDFLELARDLIQLGNLRHQQRNLLAARQLFEEALELAYHSGNANLLCDCLRGLGQKSVDLGDLPRAALLFRDALTVVRELGQINLSVGLLGDLGNLMLSQKRLPEAEHHFLAMLSATDGQPPGRNRLVALTYLGWTLLEQKKWVLAEGRLEQAASLAEVLNLPLLEQAMLKLLQSWLLRSTERWQQADALLKTLDEETILEDPELSWRYALERALVTQALSDQPSNAMSCWEKGISAVERARDKVPDGLRRSFLETSVQLTQGWIRALWTAQASPLQLLLACESTRARSLQDQHSISSSAQLEGSLLAQVPANTIVLEAQVLPDGVLWLVIENGRIQPIYVSVREEILVRLCRSIRIYFQDNKLTSSGHSLAQRLSEVLFSPLRELFRRLEPSHTLLFCLQGELYGLPLHALPLPRGHERAGEPLVMAASVAYIPSLQLWLHALKTTAKAAAEGPALLLDDPTKEFGGDPLRPREYQLTLSPSQAQSLKAATRPPDRIELSLAALASTGTCDVRREEAATLEALQSLGPHAAWIHLYTHADGPEGWKDISLEEALSEDGATHSGSDTHAANPSWERALKERMPPYMLLARGQSPTLLSRTWPDLKGMRVGAEDIEAIKLRARLVVMQSCASGVGRLSAAGEGHALLPLAFLRAGAQAVLSAGWLVSTHASPDFMRDFYGVLLKFRQEASGRADGLTFAQALAQVQRVTYETARAGGDHTHDWAVFSLLLAS